MANNPSFNAALSQSVGGDHSIMSEFRLGNISSLRLWLSFLQSNLSEPGIASDLVGSWHVIFNDEREPRNEEKMREECVDGVCSVDFFSANAQHSNLIVKC